MSQISHNFFQFIIYTRACINAQVLLICLILLIYIFF